MTNNRALILGIGGQDGSYLAELLVEKGYEVHGLYRRSSVDNLWRVRHLIDSKSVTLHRGDLTDTASVMKIVKEVIPSSIYNEADQDDVNWSHEIVGYSLDVTYSAVGRLLEGLRYIHYTGKFFQPLSATIFGLIPGPHDEKSPLDPRSPYACAKAGLLYLCRHYRKTHGMWIATGIMYNHHSPRRGDGYLLSKLCRGAVRIKAGLQEKIELWGDPQDALEIGHADDYMDGAWRALQVDNPEDYVLATGCSRTIWEWCTLATRFAGLYNAVSDYVTISKVLFPKQNPYFCGNPTKAKQSIGWQSWITPEDLVKEMIRHEERKLL